MHYSENEVCYTRTGTGLVKKELYMYFLVQALMHTTSGGRLGNFGDLGNSSDFSGSGDVVDSSGLGNLVDFGDLYKHAFRQGQYNIPKEDGSVRKGLHLKH